MGGVQPKPERRGPVLERQKSSTKKQKIVPINSKPRAPTADLCKHVEDLMRSYQADCKDDKDLQTLDVDLKSGAIHVIRSSGFGRFKQCLRFLMHSNEEIVNVILSCTKTILEASGKGARRVMTVNERLLDILIEEYLKNSLQTHQLCKLELQDFINSAWGFRSCINDVVLEKKTTSKKLNEFKKKYDSSAEAVVSKVKSLGDQHRAMLNMLKKKIDKFDKKQELIRTLKKVVNVVFIGMLSGLFVCTIMAAAMAAPAVASALTAHPCLSGFVAGGAVLSTFSPVLKGGQHWLLTFFQAYESTLEAHKGVIKSMEAGTGEAIKELDDIMCHVKQVIAKGSDPELSNLSSANLQGRVDLEIKGVIVAKLKDFEKEIEELDKKRKQCLGIIEKARNQVVEEYNELKKSQVWSTKEQ